MSRKKLVKTMQDQPQKNSVNDPKGTGPFDRIATGPLAPIQTLEPPEHEDATGPVCHIERIVKDYRIIRTVSETSTSIVYKAEDIRTKRRVAIKVIYNRGVPDFDRIHRARVEIERLRHLAHPGIAALLDAGLTEEGHCYFVNEFIKGVTLNEYLAIHKLSTEDRLSIFAQLCEAVHYAHQKCLLHRDLRPSNILIDGKCSPKIVGLGVAAVTDVDVGPVNDHSGKRELREFAAYKSPEQLSDRLFDVDVRSEVYTLGVILYELLTDRLPYSFDSEDGKAIVQTALNEMPPKPSSIKPSLRGDLEAIVLKALEKQPSDRYQTVSALSHDLANYFDQRPVGARRAGAMYEFRKFATRYKSRSISVVIMTLAVLAFGIHIHVTTREAGKKLANDIEQRMAVEIAQERMARDVAVDALNKSRADVIAANQKREQVIAQIAEKQAALTSVDAVKDELKARTEELERRAAQAEHMSQFWAGLFNPRRITRDAWPGVAKLLEAGVTRVNQDFANEPLVRAGLLNDIGAAFSDNGDAGRAIQPLEEALKIRTEKLGENGEPTIETLNYLASAYFGAGRNADAEPVCRKLVDSTQLTFGNEHPRTLTALNNLGMTLYSEKKMDEAMQFLGRALDGRRKVLGNRDKRTALTAQNLGRVQFDAGKYDAAAASFDEAASILGNALPANHWMIAETKSRYGACLTQLGRFEDAEKELLPAYDALKGAKGAPASETTAAFQRILRCYEAWKKPERTEAFLKKQDPNYTPVDPPAP